MARRVTELSRGQSTGTLRPQFWRTGEDKMGKAGGILDITAGATMFVAGYRMQAAMTGATLALG